MKSIVVCADDYAINKSVSAGIRDLIKAKRLSATSCMTNSPHWPEEGQLLKQFLNKVDIGLHFNLTHQFNNNNKFQDLNILIIKSLLRSVKRKWIEQELHYQLDKFEQELGSAPNYIDGHHHVHVFPVVRDVLIQVLKERYEFNKRSKIWVRNVNPSFISNDSAFKTLMLKVLSYNFAKLALKNDFDISGDLLGVYSLSLRVNYTDLVKDWLHHAKNRSLLMCHPGLLVAGDDFDSSMEVRQMEYQFFMNSAFLRLCQEENVQIVRLSSLE